MAASKQELYRQAALDPSCDLSQIKVDDEFQNTLLLYFIAMEDEETFLIQIANRADILSFIDITDKANGAGNTPLLFAIKRGFFNLARLLIEKGADVSISDAQGCNAFHFACLLRDENLLNSLCASQSYLKNKAKCLEQETKRDHMTPVDWYLYEAEPQIFSYIDSCIIKRNAWNYRASSAPKCEDFVRPKVIDKYLQEFQCSQASETMLQFAQQQHDSYFRNRPYIQSIIGVGVASILSPTEIEALRTRNLVYTRAAYYRNPALSSTATTSTAVPISTSTIFLEEFSAKHKELRCSGFFGGFFTRTKLKPYNELDTAEIISHARKSTTFFGGKNRSREALEAMGVMDVNGMIIANNKYNVRD